MRPDFVYSSRPSTAIGVRVYPQLHLYVGTRLVHSGDLTMPTELGRQSDDNDPVYSPQPRNGSIRIAIAQKELKDMSRQLLLVTPLAFDRIRIENIGKQVIQVVNQDALERNQQREMQLPVELAIFDRRIKILRSKLVETVLLSMNDPVSPPGSSRESFSAELSSKLPLAEKLSAQEREQFVRWLGGVTSVLQSAIGSSDFSERAAKEMVELIGLDSGRVLDVAQQEDWTVVASYQRRRARTRAVHGYQFATCCVGWLMKRKPVGPRRWI